MDRHASQVCQAGRSDCGGLCLLFCSILRSQGVPARCLVGRWATSAKPGAKAGAATFFQQHVKAEFYVEHVGWVPLDCSSAILHDKSPEGLRFFGHDPGDFLVLHLDPELEVDTLHFGRKKLNWLQGVDYWVTGDGTLEGCTKKEDWVVEALPQ
jgi:transglutaminase-like putative cysteine protease